MLLLGSAQARAFSIKLRVVSRMLWLRKDFAAEGVRCRTSVSAPEPVADKSGVCWRNSQREAGKSQQELNAESLRALDVSLEKLLGPRVEHLIAHQPGMLSDIVATALELPIVRLELGNRFDACSGSETPGVLRGLQEGHSPAEAAVGLQATDVLMCGSAGVCAGAGALWSGVLLRGAAANERAGAAEDGSRARAPGTGGSHRCRGRAGQGSTPPPGQVPGRTLPPLP